jgi:hypothetical protein
MSVDCALECGNPVNPHDVGTWKEVRGWVGGPRKDAMTLREDTGRYAHDHCVRKARKGQAPDQPELSFEEARVEGKTIVRDTSEEISDLEGMLDG